MPNTRSEDIIFLLDTSRSMYRKDIGEQSRIATSIKAIKEIMAKNKELDKSDRFAIVTFSGKVKQIKEMFFDIESIMKFIEDNAEFEKGTSYGEALTGAIRLIVEELRKIGEKTIRIILVSDGIALTSAINPLNVAKIAKELNIIIDVLRIGPAKVAGNVLKRLTELTNGDYLYANDLTELSLAIKKISAKKELATATIFDKDKKQQSLSNEILSEIAGELLQLDDLTPDQKFKVGHGDPTQKMKCSICYSNKCPTCQTNFYGCGRFCPNCLTPVHMHCAMAWADQQSKKDNLSNEKVKIFRCVHCFYLLKIPVKTAITLKCEDIDSGDRTVVKIPIKNAPEDVLKLTCSHPDCGIMFNEDEDEFVYKCNNCNSYFHTDCFMDFFKDEHKCPNCKKVVNTK